jgi:hypothetical protein
MRSIPIVSLVFLATGCVADDNDPAPPDEVVRTVVVLQPDGGAPSVTTDHITRAEHEAELAIHAALAKGERPLISYDGNGTGPNPGCAGADMWIFDNTGNVAGAFPFNHEICFIRNGSNGCAQLQDYARLCTYYPSPPYWSCSNWATSSGSWIQSFFSGVDTGFFTGQEDPAYFTDFYTFDRQDYAATSNTHGFDPRGVSRGWSVCFFPI